MEGKILFTEMYSEGKMHGTFIYYDAVNGDIISTCEFEDDKLISGF